MCMLDQNGFSDFTAWPSEHMEGNLFKDNFVQPSSPWGKQYPDLSTNQWPRSLSSFTLLASQTSAMIPSAFLTSQEL